jgi:hypothetical protein
VSYKKAKDPANYQYDCDQIKDASHDVRILVSQPLVEKLCHPKGFTIAIWADAKLFTQ